MKACKFAVAALLLLVLAQSSASARTCSVGDSGITYNRAGIPAKFASLRAHQGMNCASARYVLNRWLRPAYGRTYSYRLPRTFWDGYVTWYCGKVSYLRWRCDEYDSGTTFGFSAWHY